MTILISLASFILGIGILVAVHEFGHYWVARRLGVKVLRFSIGFGRPLWLRRGKDADQVEYVFAAIPLGGYVRLLDEREAPVPPEQAHRAFNRQPVWKRIAILLAGAGFNFIFAILAYWVLFLTGIPALKPVVGQVTPASFAANAGLRENDRIDAVAGERIATQEEALLGILDDMIADGKIDLKVNRPQQGERDIHIDVGSRRTALTQPDALLSGLGFDFWMPPPVIGRLIDNGTAQRAGLRVGDRVLSVDGKPVGNFIDMALAIRAHPDQTIGLRVKRDAQELQFQVHAEGVTENGHQVGRIGVDRINPPEDMRATQKFGPLEALARGAQKTWDTATFTVRIFGNAITGNVSLKNFSGPISIAEYTGVAVRQGWDAFLMMLALISISLGVMNLLPIPILDGGQIVFQLAELIKGSPVSERAQIRGQQVGILFLFALMSLAFYNDIARIILTKFSS